MRRVHIYRADGDEVEPVIIRVEHHAPAVPYDTPDYAAVALTDLAARWQRAFCSRACAALSGSRANAVAAMSR